MKTKLILVILVFLTGLLACEKTNQVVFRGFQQPTNFPQPAYHFNTNPVTKAGFELGRKLFYDTRLSSNNTISCGSCHIQTSAFTHHGHTVSHGIFDLQGIRNAPPIMNLAWNTSFMWDGGIADMDLQSVAPITNPIEMNETMPGVLAKLRASSDYAALFKAAFGKDEITGSDMLRALSQFMAMCVSSNSRYDSIMRGDAGKGFTPAEAAGQTLFRQKCSACHPEPLFTDFSFRNNGLPPSMVNDEGRAHVTQVPQDLYKFKVPSLRNLTYTAPFMHDGRFLSLEAVLDHYHSGVQPMATLDPLLQQGATTGIPLTATEKQQIIAFLLTLNDKSFLLDPLFAEQ